MADEQNAPVPSIIDGGEPTDQEALLASQVDTIGDNPTEEPVVPTPATNDAGTEAAQAPTAAEPAAAEPAAKAIVPTPDPAPVAAPVRAAAPVAPRDFDADITENQRRFDDGEIEGDEYQKQLRTLTREEGAFTARVAIWEERQQTAVQQAAAEFNGVAVQWEKANSTFMGNPLRAQAMQQAIEAVFAKSPGLAPAQLFDQAAKVAFEAFGYTPPTPSPAVDTAKALADALAGRSPSGVPPTLSSSPAAAPIEAAAGNSAYASLDSKDIGSLEDAIARMSNDQREAYLRDAPGAGSTGV